MSWEMVRLGDYCTKIGSGATPKGGTTVYINDGVSLIRSQNVYNLFFEYDGLTHITDDTAEKLNGVTIIPNDILLNITGDSVARVCMVPMDVLPARVNQHVAIIRTEKRLLPQYLLFYLASPYMQAYMLNLAVGKGASRNALTKGMIEDFPIPLPSIEEQQKIVNILSPYNNLIENGHKQIKLLEEAAQRLYKELFVDLRFPGYKNTPVVDGVPEGWEVLPLEQIAPIMTGKKDANFSTDDGQYPFFTCAQESLLAPSYSFDCDAVILAGNGDFNVKLYRGQFEAYQRTYVLSPNNKDYLFLLFHAVSNSMTKLAQGASGSTIKFLTKGMIASIPIFVPDKQTLCKFNGLREAIQQRIEILKETIVNAIEARDRLLSKLMNGEIEV